MTSPSWNLLPTASPRSMLPAWINRYCSHSGLPCIEAHSNAPPDPANHAMPAGQAVFPLLIFIPVLTPPLPHYLSFCSRCYWEVWPVLLKLSSSFLVRIRRQLIIKGGHPQFKSTPPQCCGQPNQLWSCGLKYVAELRVRTDLQNLTSAILQLSAVSCQFRYFLVPFISSGWFYKSTKNIFRTVCFSGNKNFP
jgi:hypothetical protein